MNDSDWQEIKSPRNQSRGVATDEWFCTYEGSGYLVKLRVLRGGNNRFTPICEIKFARPFIATGPQGGRYETKMLSDLGKQSDDLQEAKDRTFDLWRKLAQSVPLAQEPNHEANAISVEAEGQTVGARGLPKEENPT